MARKPETSERTCIVTREAQPPSGLIRFVRAPDGTVVPDVKEKLPGRGVWVTGRRDVVEQAVRKRLFGRGFRADAVADEHLPDLVDRLLAEQALSALSLARKAGRVVTGFGKVTSALARGQAIAVIHAVEAADDGRRKVAQVMRRRARHMADDGAEQGVDWDEEAEDELPIVSIADDDDGDDVDEMNDMDVPPTGGTGPGKTEQAHVALPKVIGGLFSGGELDLALGGANVIHAALLAGGASTSFLKSAAALARYRGGMPETDWTAGG